MDEAIRRIVANAPCPNKDKKMFFEYQDGRGNTDQVHYVNVIEVICGCKYPKELLIRRNDATILTFEFQDEIQVQIKCQELKDHIDNDKKYTIAGFQKIR